MDIKSQSRCNNTRSFYRCFSQHYILYIDFDYFISVSLSFAHTCVCNLYLFSNRVYPSVSSPFTFSSSLLRISPPLVELESAANLHVQIELANRRFVCWIVRSSRSKSLSLFPHLFYFLLLAATFSFSSSSSSTVSVSGNRGYF